MDLKQFLGSLRHSKDRWFISDVGDRAAIRCLDMKVEGIPSDPVTYLANKLLGGPFYRNAQFFDAAALLGLPQRLALQIAQASEHEETDTPTREMILEALSLTSPAR